MTKLSLTKNLFKTYKKNIVWIKHNSNFKNKSKEHKQEVSSWIEFNSYLDSVLDNMTPDNAEFIKLIFLDQKNKDFFAYSDSAYYFRRRKAIDEFVKFYERIDIANVFDF